MSTDMQEQPSQFASQKEVLQYLKGCGWKIEKSALSNHVRARLLKKKEGVFRLADVDAYAYRTLSGLATGQTAADEKSAVIQDRRMKAEADLKEEQALTARIQREALEGKLIPRADVALENAGRAVLLDSGIRGLIQASAPGWIEAVVGDQARLPDLVEQMYNGFGDLLNQYASTKEFVLEIGKEKE